MSAPPPFPLYTHTPKPSPYRPSGVPLPKQVKVDGDPLMETRILEASLAKICSLLAVGFGDAGAEVIGDNIKSGGDLNPMIPGHKVIGIYGFCDIRQFTDATEVLQVLPRPLFLPPPPPVLSLSAPPRPTLWLLCRESVIQFPQSGGALQRDCF